MKENKMKYQLEKEDDIIGYCNAITFDDEGIIWKHVPYRMELGRGYQFNGNGERIDRRSYIDQGLIVLMDGSLERKELVKRLEQVLVGLR